MNTITIKQFVNSVYSSNSFILISEKRKNKEVWIIDVGDTCEIVKQIPRDADIKGVLFTHTHYDHIYGMNKLLSLYPCVKLYTNKIGKQALCSPKLNYSRYHHEEADIVCCRPENINIINGGDRFFIFDEFEIEVIATPGHDASCLTYLVGNYVFSGDALIPGVETRSIFLLSDKKSVKYSEKKIEDLSMHKTLCPGHGPIYYNYNNDKQNILL